MIWCLRQMSAIFCSSSLEKTLPTGLSVFVGLVAVVLVLFSLCMCVCGGGGGMS